MQYIPGQSLYGSQHSLERKGMEMRGFAAPEIVSHSPNPYWEEFYAQMCYDIVKNKNHFGDNIRIHLAKQYNSLKGMMKYMRNIYNDPNVYFYPHDQDRRRVFKYNTALKLWKEVRNRFDPQRVFTNPWVEQFFYSDNDTYINNENEGYFLSESGSVGENKNCVIL